MSTKEKERHQQEQQQEGEAAGMMLLMHHAHADLRHKLPSLPTNVHDAGCGKSKRSSVLDDIS